MGLHERVPQIGSATRQAQPRVPGQRTEELRKSWPGLLRVARQVIAGQAGGGGLGGGDAAEIELLDHEARDDLLLAGELVLRLVFHQLGLAHQESDEPNALLGELVVHVTQPFESMCGQALRLVAEQHDDMPLAQLKLFAEPTREREALLRDARGLGVAHAGGGEQRAEEWTLELGSMVFARHPQHEQVGTLAIEVQRRVVDRVCLAHAWPGVHQRAGDKQANAVFDQVDQLLDRGGGDSVVPSDQRMQRRHG